MEMDDNVPSVGNTEEVPHEATQEYCDPLIESGIPVHEDQNHASSTLALNPNVKYLFCKYCPYKTRFVGNLTKHVRTHTGEKPFSCRHCGKRFASRSNLNYHEATHTGNKRFQCFISGCQFKTQLRDSLNSHMRKIHGVLMQQNSSSTPTFTSAIGDQIHSPPAGPTGIPVLSPITSISNLPPIQDILTSPAVGLSSLHSSMPPNLTSPVDVKPSVAELAQYMIALHEGTNPIIGKQDVRQKTPIGNNLVPFSTTGEYNAVKSASGEDGFTTSPVTVETDTESNQDSPRVAPPAVHPDPFPMKPWGDNLLPGCSVANSMGTIQNSVASIMPRLSASHPLNINTNNNPMKGVLRTNELVTTALAAGDPPKSSALSCELLKIFQNLGLDTMAILELLAAQGRLHICRSCNIVFPEYSTFVLHRGCHGNEGPFQCHFCQRKFPEKFGFLTHFMQCPNK